MSYQNFVQPSKNFTDLAYSKELGIWNASAGTDGQILYSYDGLNWSNCTLPLLTAPKFNQVEYGIKSNRSPLFVAHAGIVSSDQQYILISTNGINYTLANSTIFCTKLVYGNSWFFAFTNNYFFRSQNGIFWEQISSLPPTGGKPWKYGSFGKNSLVVFSETGTQSCAVTYNYGSTWERYTPPAEFTDVVFDDTKFVAVSPTTSSVYTSANGKNWTLVNNSTSIDMLTVYYGNIVGVKPNTNTVYSSIDHGATWSSNSVTNSADWSAMGTRQGFSIPVAFATPIPTAATPTPTTTPLPSPTPTLAPTSITASNINNIITNSLMPTDGFGFTNTSVTGQPLSITFTQTGTTPEYVQVQFTNNTTETITVVIAGVTYTVLPGGSFNQTTLLNPGDTVVISGPSGNYNAGDLVGGIVVVPAPTPTPTPTLAPTDITASNINNITTNSLMPTNGFGFTNTSVTGQPLSVTFTQTGTTPEYVQVQFTNNSTETVTVVIAGVTYTIPPGGSFNQTTLLNPGDTVVISGPSGNYNAGDLSGSIAVVPAPTPTPTPTPTLAPTDITASNINNITTNSLMPTNGFGFTNTSVTGQPLSVTFTQTGTTPEYVQVQFTNNSTETVTVVIAGVTYTIPPGGSFNQTTLLNPGDTVVISGPSGNYNAGDLSGSIAVVPAPSPTTTMTPTPTPTPTLTASPTPSPSPSPSPSPTPSPTPIPNKIWLWGNGFGGLLGNNESTGFAKIPMQPNTEFTDFNNCVSNPRSIINAFVTNNGRLFAWGANSYGNIGDGTIIDKSSPVQIGNETNWSMIDASDHHTVAVKTDGTLWAWGFNSYGQLGLNDKVHRSSPVQVGTNSSWVKCAAGQDATYAITNTGTMWACGKNYNGELGIRNNTFKSSLTQILGNTWSEVKAGLVFAAALKTDNTLWLWGYNYYGQLGINQSGNEFNSPVQEITASTWSSFALLNSSVAAIKSGNIYTWGQNTAGSLAQGAVGPEVNQPTQILYNDGTFISVAGAADTLLAIKSNGQIWGAGDRSDYELDNNLNLPSNTDSIIQVALGKNWANVFAIQNTVIGKEA